MRKSNWLHSNLQSFESYGISFLGKILSKQDADSILRSIKASRPFDSNLFLLESEFASNQEFRGVNPRPGRNFLETIASALDPIDKNARLDGLVSKLLGDEYYLLDRKVVCGIPEWNMPLWLRSRLDGRAINNLGAYIKPEYRDITYFYGIDYHQDLIDWPEREPNFITLYVYLDDVGVDDAPLTLLAGSHHLGATEFPHDLELSDPTDRIWTYKSSSGEVECSEKKFMAGAGSAAIWHACTLHGTTPPKSTIARISLRYLLTSRQIGNRPNIVDIMNTKLFGSVSQKTTRRDQSSFGEIVKSGNKLIESVVDK